MRKPIEDFIEREPNSGCWLWTGGIDKSGYGLTKVYSSDGTRKTVAAHRVLYQMNRGPIPTGLEIDHLCRVRCCVNPAHLEPVTRSVNIRRGLVPEIIRARARLITHCPQDHEYTPENTRIRRGKRECKICANIRSCAYGKRIRALRSSQILISANNPTNQ